MGALAYIETILCFKGALKWKLILLILPQEYTFIALYTLNLILLAPAAAFDCRTWI